MQLKRHYAVFALLALMVISSVSAAGLANSSANKQLPMLKAKDTFIVDESDKTVVLKGCNLGNWFAMEMWMMHIYDEKIKDQYTFESVLAARFGEEQKERLMDMFRANWITERDFKIIKSFGMNCVRIPIYYQLIEDDANPMKLKANAWKWMDYAVDTAEKYGIYTILCLHGA
ncbi:MAG TPA: endoglucanase, partial [Desulfobacteraceae bacterium]|nr:endoglucanase [Desulfobacteraceae bacterium]